MITGEIYTGGTDLSAENIIGSLEWIINRFESYGINVNKTSRFYKFYCDFIKINKSVIVPDNMDELLEGMRDFFELRQIASSDEVLNNSKKELNELLGGNRIPSADKNPLARNLQYQLYLASIFCASGMMVYCEEPDFTFNYMGVKYSVAAKRLTSNSKINKRIKEAEKQILKYSYDGFIALSLDRLLDIKNPLIITMDHEVLNEATKDLLFNIIKNNFSQACFANRSDKIKGIILTLGIPSFTPGEMAFGYGFNLHLFPLVNPKDKDEFNRIGRITANLSPM